jgi:hypothetical protein
VDKLDIGELRCEKQGVVANPLRVTIGLCFSHYNLVKRKVTSPFCNMRRWSCATIQDLEGILKKMKTELHKNIRMGWGRSGRLKNRFI